MNAASPKPARPAPALSDLSVTEFLTLSRMGFLPHGLVIGSSVYDAGLAQSGWNPQTEELTQLSHAMRAARHLAVNRMRDQAKMLDAEGVVGVRLLVEHHRWRSGHTVAKFIAVGTAIAFDHDHGPEELRGAPSLKLTSGVPFTSDLSGQDFVALLRAGYRPVSITTGTCVYQLDPRHARLYVGHDVEIAQYTQAFFDARELAMERLQQDLFSEHPPGHPDAPVGIVGMTVEEKEHGDLRFPGPPVIEFSAIGTAIAELSPSDPRRAPQRPKPNIVVPLDR